MRGHPGAKPQAAAPGSAFQKNRKSGPIRRGVVPSPTPVDGTTQPAQVAGMAEVISPSRASAAADTAPELPEVCLEMGHGSARSIEAYHLFDGLTECRDLLEKFGGHSHAAGLTIRRDRVSEFRTRLNSHAASCLSDDDLVPALRIDAEIPAAGVTLELADQLCALEPYGAGNPRPIFMSRNLHILSEPTVMKEEHLKMRVAGDEGGRPLEAVWWRGLESAGRTPHLNERIELAYAIEPNKWNGETRLQLNVKDMRSCQ